MEVNNSDVERLAKIDPAHSYNTKKSSLNTKDTRPTPSANTSTTGVIINGTYHGDMSVRVTVNLPKSIQRPKRIEFNIDDCVPTFTGREDFIKDLHEEIQNNQKSQSQSARSQAVVISGMAGVGKTQLVRKYIELYKKQYDHVLWINAESYSVAISCFLRIASKISIDLNYDGRKKLDEDILEEIWDFVCQKSTLIVYDNVEILTGNEGSKNSLHQLLPQINFVWKTPAIIVTTRHRHWDNFTFRDLKGFDENESWELLSKQDFKDNEDNRYLVKELQKLCEGLPLGVQQGISFIRYKRKTNAVTSKGPYTAQDFIKEVSVNRRKILSTEPPEFVSKSLYALLEMAFKQMETIEHGELALQCLELMAILSPDNIPTVLINEFFKDEGKNLGEALILLHDRNLITSYNEFYQIHRMIQAISLESRKIESCYAKKNQNLMSVVIDFFTKFLEALAINSGQVHEIINNAVIIHQQISPDTYSEEILKFQTILSKRLGQLGCYKIALTISQELLKTHEKLLGEDGDRTIEFKETLCFALFNAGSYDQSQKLFTDVLQKRNKIFGPYHHATLNTKHNLAETLHLQGKCEEAHQIYQDILETRTNILGPEHLDTLDMKSNVAGVLKSKGRYKEAYVMYMDILEIQNKIFGHKNPGTLSTKQKLADVLMYQENNEEAYLIYNDILEINSTLLGAEHKNTILTKQKIAAVLNNQSKYEEAYEIYNEILEVHSRIFGPEHPKTLSTKHDMANILKRQEMYDDAIQIYSGIIKIQSKIMGPDHPDTLDTKHFMAGALKYQEKYEEAYQIYKSILEIRNAILGPEHPSTLNSQHNVADVLESQERYEEAYLIYNEVLKRRNAVLGPEHPNSLFTRNNIAGVLVRQEKYEEAFRIYSEILEIEIKIMGADHPDAFATKHKVANVLNHLERYEEAFKIYNEVLESRMTVLGPEHWSTLGTKQHLADGLESQGRYEEAFKIYSEVLESHLKVLGPEHLSTLGKKQNLAFVLGYQGKYEETFKIFNEVLQTRIKVLGTDHPTTLTTKNSMADVLKRQGRYEEAYRIYSEVLTSRSTVLGPEHQSTLATKYSMANVLKRQASYEKAQQIYKDFSHCSHTVVGPVSSSLFRANDNMVDDWRYQGNFMKGDPVLVEVLQDENQKLPPDHSDILVTKHQDISHSPDKHKNPIQNDKDIENKHTIVGQVQFGAPVSKSEIEDILTIPGKFEDVFPIKNETLETENKIQSPGHPDLCAITQNSTIIILDNQRLASTVDSVLKRCCCEIL